MNDRVAHNRPTPDANHAGVKVTDINLWRGLLQARNSRDYVESWLQLQCSMLAGVRAAVVILGPAEKGPYTPVAFWPAGEKRRDFAPLAEKSLQERKSYIIDVEPDENARSARRIAYPLIISARLHGVAILEIANVDDNQAQEAMRTLQWGCAWLESLLLRQGANTGEGLNKTLVKVLGLTSSVLEQDSVQGAAMKLVNDCASYLEVSRVSIGLIESGHLKLRAVSHNADFDERMNLARHIEAAMNEALDQQQLILYPPLDQETANVAFAHRQLIDKEGMAVACTVPLQHEGQWLGALMLEADKGSVLDTGKVEIAKRLASLVSAIFALKMNQERGVFRHAALRGKRQLGKIIGPGFIGRKLALMSLLLVVLAAIFVQSEFRVTARSYLEGSVQSAVVAPFDSFVSSAPVRAGDIVEAGTVLLTLDDRDLRLEYLRLETQRRQIESQLREAMSNRERAQSNILEAQVAQVDAQLELISEQISRTRLNAPFSGVVVSGDQSQNLGAPLQKGELLFQIAPLDSYRIVLEVDDQDIALVRAGQKGSLVLSAYPDTNMAFSVTRVTPVATAQEGRNYFRVEATLEELSYDLRPGMEGVAKVNIDRRNLFGILTRDLRSWFQLWAWSRLP